MFAAVLDNIVKAVKAELNCNRRERILQNANLNSNLLRVTFD
jgi:hypothetical protein